MSHVWIWSEVGNGAFGDACQDVRLPVDWVAMAAGGPGVTGLWLQLHGGFQAWGKTLQCVLGSRAWSEIAAAATVGRWKMIGFDL